MEMAGGAVISLRGDKRVLGHDQACLWAVVAM